MNEKEETGEVEKPEFKVDPKSIRTKEELISTYKALHEQYVELLKATPGVAKEAVVRGYNDAVKAVNARCDQMKADRDRRRTERKNDLEGIDRAGQAQEMGLAWDVAARNTTARDWQQAHEGRSSKVTGAVDRVQRAETDIKSKIAIGAIKLATLGAKGARLFGAKGLAQTIIDRGSTYARALLTKDSRMSELAQNMAENGFIAADKVRDTIAAAQTKIEERKIVAAANREAKQAAKEEAERRREAEQAKLKAAREKAEQERAAEQKRKQEAKARAEAKKAEEQAKLKAAREKARADRREARKNDIEGIDRAGQAQEMGLAWDVASRNTAARDWQQAHEGRSSKVTGAVDRVQRAETDIKSRVAIGTIKLATLGAKGARLFGAKGLAHAIQDRGSTYARALLTKDSRMSELAQNMAENGFIAADKVRDTIAAAQTRIDERKTVIAANREARRNDIESIDRAGQAQEMGLAWDVAARNTAARDWQQAHEGRSSKVTGAVDRVQRAETGIKSRVAIGAIKLATLGAKGARLFGAKGLAQTIQDRGSTYAHALLTKDSRISELAQNMAESGFMRADDVRRTIEHSKTMVGAYARAGVDVGKQAGEQVIDATKKGALAIGKAAVVPVAAVGALGTLSVEAVRSGVHKIEEGTKTAADKVRDVRDTARVGFWGKINSLVDKVKETSSRHLDEAVASKESNSKQKDQQQKDQDEGR